MPGTIYLKGQLSEFDLISYETPADGNCFFHAICSSYYIGYRKQRVRGKSMTKRIIVANLRLELAQKLSSIDPSTGESYYLGLSNGNVASLGENVFRYSLAGETQHLNSSDPVGDEVIAYVSKILKKDIYILSGKDMDVYNMPDIPSGEWPSIVLFYKNGHYELVGVSSGDKHDVYLSNTHPFILALRERLISFKS